MAQSTYSIRMDSELKKDFDSICEDFGMSSTTAINVFAKTVVRERCIPFEIKSGNRGMEAFNALRESARKNGIQDMSIDEIDEEISRARKGIGR
ncbi:MAG: type II toxin-antitoxin system RelB/DinJ family antitoxin [Spirochaetes bacterium]|uniref:Type II toxin-antitoxin system RelB/DinJ family antitoxin n=1 Tax=Candidatus Aphodenecus pullistercoris TaxID=2840669 RepID=A0A9D9E9Y9_9SPIR|nr:type II toxin-antitoxin system RelB/DinJ family antitoxin [Candidatus Aphodenecus pullistercoris]